MKDNQNFEDYKERFRSMLVKRYNWTVGKAAEFEDERLDNAYKKGLSPEEAYSVIFSKEQDLVL